MSGGGLVETHMDHRIAMAFLILGSAPSARDRRRHIHDRNQLPEFRGADDWARRRLPMIIAIDGPAASGKGTIAKLVAAHYGLPISTPARFTALSRATRLPAAAIPPMPRRRSRHETLDPATLDDPVAPRPALGEAASHVASHAEVRRAVLLAYQRSLRAAKAWCRARRPGYRTVICPDAEVKFFVTATPEERARRRYLELKAAGTSSARPMSLPISGGAISAIP